ncbi:Fe-S cluster assembly protein SufD [bacterium]|nr:Fe-S cluster assembly protein SufD [bacterium]
MTEAIAEKNLYAAEFAELSKELAAAEPSWLTEIRKVAFERFAALGVPTRRQEEYGYTSLDPIAEKPFSVTGTTAAVTADKLTPFLYGDLEAHLLVFVDGRYQPELSKIGDLPAGVTVKSLMDVLTNDADSIRPHLAQYADYQSYAMIALNTALMTGGTFIHLPAGVKVETPIHILNLVVGGDQPTSSQTRNVLVAEDDSSATIIESWIGTGNAQTFTNTVLEAAVGANTDIDHYKLQREHVENGYHYSSLYVTQGDNSRFRSHSFAMGGALVRNDVFGYLDGEGIDCIFNGLLIGTGKQHIDNFMQVDHAKPNCDSHELYKGILDDNATAVFRGRIHVHPDAQKTDAKQTNQNLLLSDNAQAVAKPQLEIYADDVKCTHGATIGELDDSALFYLRSRGIPSKSARNMLIRAFAGDVTERVHVDQVRETVEEILYNRLPH